MDGTVYLVCYVACSRCAQSCSGVRVMHPPWTMSSMATASGNIWSRASPKGQSGSLPEADYCHAIASSMEAEKLTTVAIVQRVWYMFLNDFVNV